MRKIIVMFLGLFFIAGFVFVQGEQVKPAIYGEKQTKTIIMDGNRSENFSKGPISIQNGTEVHTGLYSALANVKNENARRVLERNMQRFLEKYQARLENASSIEIEIDEETNETIIKAKEKVKYFGFIDGKATKKFKIENNGKVTEKNPWYRFMYVENQPE